MELEALRLLEISSFFNVWYWLFLAFVWSRATYWTLGVPLHDARLAVQRDGRYMAEFETMMAINAGRYTEVFDQFGTPLVAMGAFFLAGMATLGFGFDIELVQAGFLLIAPIAVANAYTLAFAYRIQRIGLTGPGLFQAYSIHRRVKQIFGFLTLILVAIWTVYRAIYTPLSL